MQTIKYNEKFVIIVRVYDGEFGLSDHISKALDLYKIKYQTKTTEDFSERYKQEWEFNITCNGIQEVAMIYVIIGGSPKTY